MKQLSQQQEAIAGYCCKNKNLQKKELQEEKEEVTSSVAAATDVGVHVTGTEVHSHS